MSKQSEPQSSSFSDDLKTLSDTLEEVLKSSADNVDEKYQEIKTRAESALKDVKSRIMPKDDVHCVKAYCEKVRNVAGQTEDYVRDNPWRGVGVAGAVGVLIGLLLRR